ncbi:MAG: cytochrome c biogenesis protein CcsA [Pseudomonadota bacterium]|jgi:ABC-type transport system involved in cytochrome c biogenesis permease subunit
MTEFEAAIQGGIAALYLAAALLLALGGRFGRAERAGAWLAGCGFLAHFGLLLWRWQAIGQIPIVTRYEDLTVDALTMAGFYLAAQWRLPLLRRAGMLVLPLAAAGTAWALFYTRGHFPFDPSLRTNWMIIHAQLNSFALGAGTLAAGACLMLALQRRSAPELPALAGRLTDWAFFLWAAMVAAGSYWASLAWGRYWGWDPIEAWSLATVLGYAFFLHLRLKPAWRGRRWGALALIPYLMMLFTTYGLLMIRGSVHSQYLFQ